MRQVTPDNFPHTQANLGSFQRSIDTDPATKDNPRQRDDLWSKVGILSGIYQGMPSKDSARSLDFYLASTKALLDHRQENFEARESQSVAKAVDTKLATVEELTRSRQDNPAGLQDLIDLPQTAKAADDINFYRGVLRCNQEKLRNMHDAAIAKQILDDAKQISNKNTSVNGDEIISKEKELADNLTLSPDEYNIPFIARGQWLAQKLAEAFGVAKDQDQFTQILNELEQSAKEPNATEIGSIVKPTDVDGVSMRIWHDFRHKGAPFDVILEFDRNSLTNLALSPLLLPLPLFQDQSNPVQTVA